MVLYLLCITQLPNMLQMYLPGGKGLLAVSISGRITYYEEMLGLNLRRKVVFNGYVILHTRKSKSGNLMPREAKYDILKICLSEVPEDKIFAQWSEKPKFLSRKTLGKWNWHNLRHKYASLLSKNNTPIFEIMSRLGHSNIKTTQHYLQLLP